MWLATRGILACEFFLDQPLSKEGNERLTMKELFMDEKSLSTSALEPSDNTSAQTNGRDTRSGKPMQGLET